AKQTSQGGGEKALRPRLLVLHPSVGNCCLPPQGWRVKRLTRERGKGGYSCVVCDAQGDDFLSPFAAVAVAAFLDLHSAATP
ncbi:MAG TPA: hypothetical protein VHM88_17070, partial [Candidatus Acidoferrales bacterium]|nr:hypothetical protein [Candidatus Acidoferrales bacterium]